MSAAQRRFNVAVVGATGIAGQQFLTSLESHPWFTLKRLAASQRSAYDIARRRNPLFGSGGKPVL